MISSEFSGQLIVINSRWTAVPSIGAAAGPAIPGNVAWSVCRSAPRATGSRSSPKANAVQNLTSPKGSPRLAIRAGRPGGPPVRSMMVLDWTDEGNGVQIADLAETVRVAQKYAETVIIGNGSKAYHRLNARV
jgi:hypothetical protein